MWIKKVKVQSLTPTAMLRSKWRIHNASLLGLWLISMSSYAEQSPAATPYRPTVSNPAELSALHHLEVELGAQLNQPSEQEYRSSAPYLLKYPFHDHWGLLVGGEAWIDSGDASSNTNGLGNTFVLLKHYHPLSSTLALGIEAGAIFPTARKPLGSGRTDYSVNLIVSQDIEQLRIDVNAGIVRQGDKEADYSRYAYSWAIAASHPLTERWGISGEFSGVFYPEQRASSQFLVTFDYAISRQFIVDFGSTIGMTHASDDYTAFAGFVWLIDP